jgi:hypothetical protein
MNVFLFSVPEEYLKFNDRFKPDEGASGNDFARSDTSKKNHHLEMTEDCLVTSGAMKDSICMEMQITQQSIC